MSSPGTLFFWLLIRTMAIDVLRPDFGEKRGNLLYVLTEQDTSGFAGESEWQLQCTGINQDDEGAAASALRWREAKERLEGTMRSISDRQAESWCGLESKNPPFLMSPRDQLCVRSEPRAYDKNTSAALKNLPLACTQGSAHPSMHQSLALSLSVGSPQSKMSSSSSLSSLPPTPS